MRRRSWKSISCGTCANYKRLDQGHLMHVSALWALLGTVNARPCICHVSYSWSHDTCDSHPILLTLCTYYASCSLAHDGCTSRSYPRHVVHVLCSVCTQFFDSLYIAYAYLASTKLRTSLSYATFIIRPIRGHMVKVGLEWMNILTGQHF